jgi:hypothetical protein
MTQKERDMVQEWKLELPGQSSGGETLCFNRAEKQSNKTLTFVLCKT